MSAYTNVWSNSIPAGSVAANLIDDHIRQLRLDVDERLASFFTDIDVDPLVPKNASIPIAAINGSAAQGLGIWHHWSEGCVMASTMLWDGTNRLYTTEATGTGNMTWLMPCQVPVGGVVTTIAAAVNKVAGATISLTFYKVDQSNGSETSLGTVSSATTGYHTITITLAGTTLVAGFTYYAAIVLNQPAGAARLLAVKFA